MSATLGGRLGIENIKKKTAVFAAKTDGNRLFKEGKYDLAYTLPIPKIIEVLNLSTQSHMHG